MEPISKFHDQVTGPEYNTDLVSCFAPAKRPCITNIKTVHKIINTSYCVTCHQFLTAALVPVIPAVLGAVPPVKEDLVVEVVLGA